MFTSRVSDRLDSERQSKQLQDTKGAPEVVRRRFMWYNRFEEWR